MFGIHRSERGAPESLQRWFHPCKSATSWSEHDRWQHLSYTMVLPLGCFCTARVRAVAASTVAFVALLLDCRDDATL